MEHCPGYKIIRSFSDEIQPKIGQRLYCYGVNDGLSREYKYGNGLVNFYMAYTFCKDRYDLTSLEEARALVVSIAENFLIKINMDTEISCLLEKHPLTSDLVHITLQFTDENSIDLGSGIAIVYLKQGKIRYRRYEIYEYTGQYPARGRHFDVHEESYEEALKIVKEKGTMIKLYHVS